MPIYEYRCEECGHRTELIQKFSDPPLTECSQCKGKLTKVIAAPALQFKGSGFYITDYTNKGKPPKSETDKQDSAKKKDASGSKTGSDAKSPSGSKETPAKKEK